MCPLDLNFHLLSSLLCHLQGEQILGTWLQGLLRYVGAVS